MLSFGNTLPVDTYQPGLNVDEIYDGYLAPFWSDFSLSVGGKVSFRESMDSFDISRAVQMLGIETNSYEPSHMFIATWDGVALTGVSDQTKVLLSIYLLARY